MYHFKRISVSDDCSKFLLVMAKVTRYGKEHIVATFQLSSERNASTYQDINYASFSAYDYERDSVGSLDFGPCSPEDDSTPICCFPLKHRYRCGSQLFSSNNNEHEYQSGNQMQACIRQNEENSYTELLCVAHSFTGAKSYFYRKPTTASYDLIHWNILMSKLNQRKVLGSGAISACFMSSPNNDCYCISGVIDHHQKCPNAIGIYNLTSKCFTKYIDLPETYVLDSMPFRVYDIFGIRCSPSGQFVALNAGNDRVNFIPILLFDAVSLNLITIIGLDFGLELASNCPTNHFPVFSSCSTKLAILTVEHSYFPRISGHATRCSTWYVQVYGFPQLMNLQDICRTTICRHCKLQHIKRLPLPKKIIRFLQYKK